MSMASYMHRQLELVSFDLPRNAAIASEALTKPLLIGLLILQFIPNFTEQLGNTLTVSRRDSCRCCNRDRKDCPEDRDHA